MSDFLLATEDQVLSWHNCIPSKTDELSVQAFLSWNPIADLIRRGPAAAEVVRIRDLATEREPPWAD